jgi:hypothetical protein
MIIDVLHGMRLNFIRALLFTTSTMISKQSSNYHCGLKIGETDFYIAPPEQLETLVRHRALELAARPKRDGTQRSIGFRKELPRQVFQQWRNAWHLLGDDGIPSDVPDGDRLPSGSSSSGQLEIGGH